MSDKQTQENNSTTTYSTISEKEAAEELELLQRDTIQQNSNNQSKQDNKFKSMFTTVLKDIESIVEPELKHVTDPQLKEEESKFLIPWMKNIMEKTKTREVKDSGWLKKRGILEISLVH